jgi:hypothetical protein
MHRCHCSQFSFDCRRRSGESPDEAQVLEAPVHEAALSILVGQTDAAKAQKMGAVDSGTAVRLPMVVHVMVVVNMGDLVRRMVFVHRMVSVHRRMAVADLIGDRADPASVDPANVDPAQAGLPGAGPNRPVISRLRPRPSSSISLVSSRNPGGGFMRVIALDRSMR